MTWTEKRVVIDGPVKVADGYGHMTMNMIRAFSRLGYEVLARKDWTHTDLLYVPDDIRRIVEANGVARGSSHVGVRMSTPESAGDCPSAFKINYSMFEFLRAPAVWMQGLHKAHLAMVPSQWVKDIWIHSGAPTHVPIEVNQLGVDPELFTYKERSVRDEPFTFVMSGTMSERKSPWTAFQAFTKAFQGRTDVRFIIKSPAWLPIGRGPDPRQVPENDERFIIYNEVWPDDRMVQLLHDADCFVFPTKSEGWGLSPNQAMSTGLPVICTGATSCAEYMHEDHSYPLDIVGWECPPSHWGDLEGYTIPSLDHMIELMTYVESHRDEAYAKGKKAAAFVRANLTWEHNARRFVDIVNKYV